MISPLSPAQPGPLQTPALAERQSYLERPRDEPTHREIFSSLSCMNRVEAPVFTEPAAALTFPLRIAAWNLERCYFPEASADLLKAQNPGIVLLSEVDNGCARTGQRHTSKEIAGFLGMTYAYGVEFLELERGKGVELERSGGADNDLGFHGNAVLAANPLQAPLMIRLDSHGHWFRPQSKEARIGGRCAIATALATTQGPLLAISVHLESDADGPHRTRQMQVLFDAIEEISGGMPVVIGGDLNTGLADGGDFEKEGLFELAYGLGYSRHSGALDRMTTRASTLTKAPRPREWKLDWFLTRRVKVSSSAIVPALGPDGTPLSDHEMIVLDVDGLG